MYFLIVSLSLAYEHVAVIHQRTNDNVLVLSSDTVLHQPIVITKDTRVISSSTRPVKIQTKGNIPAFVVKANNVTFEGLSYDGLNFVQIDGNMRSLRILNCQVTDSKQTGHGYMLTKTKAPLRVELLQIQQSTVSNLTPVFLSQIFISDVQVEDNKFTNIIRYGVRIKNDSHVGEGESVDKLTFSNNKVNGISQGKGREGVARLLMLSATDSIVVRNNTIRDILGVGQGGNILYISGPTALDFSDNEVTNVNGSTYAIHDKGLSENKNRSISNNRFTQYPTSKIGSIINIYQSSNYRIEQNVFTGLTSPAVRISNPRPVKGEDFPSNIWVINNRFLNTDYADLIYVVQTVQGLTVKGNHINNFYNKSGAVSGREAATRLLSLVATLDEAHLSDITIEGNSVNNIDSRFTLLWLSHLKNGLIRDVRIQNNSVSGGAGLIRNRNQQKALIHVGNNVVGKGMKTIVDGSEKMIKKIYANYAYTYHDRSGFFKNTFKGAASLYVRKWF